MNIMENLLSYGASKYTRMEEVNKTAFCEILGRNLENKQETHEYYVMGNHGDVVYYGFDKQEANFLWECTTKEFDGTNKEVCPEARIFSDFIIALPDYLMVQVHNDKMGDLTIYSNLIAKECEIWQTLVNESSSFYEKLSYSSQSELYKKTWDVANSFISSCYELMGDK